MASVMRAPANWSGFAPVHVRGCASRGVRQQPFSSSRQLGAPVPIISAVAYPCNPSLEDELNRLFSDFRISHTAQQPEQSNDVWNEFKNNGLDTEYVPDSEGYSPIPYKKKSKKPVPSECVFCKNNGEDQKIYKNHFLKDTDGRIVCPILRKYNCPICGAHGDYAHTIKYCPMNKYPQPLASMNALKSLRNSTGRRRSK